MGRFYLRVETDNAAFGDGSDVELQFEVARILKGVTEALEAGNFRSRRDVPLYDRNGNRVGRAHLEDGDAE